jgi:hypothetical protein
MNKAFWLIPPVLGAVAFWIGAARAEPASAGKLARISNRGAGEATETRGASSGRSLEDFATAYQQAWSEQSRREKQKLAACSAEELQAMILRLHEKLTPHDGVTLGNDDDGEALTEAVKRLGALMKGAGLDWVLKNAPKLKEEVMDGWAEADPAGAFQRVADSTTLNPCSATTLMSLLQGFGDQDPAALKAAYAKVKWELFSKTNDPFAPSGGSPFELRPEMSVRPWVDSGVALAMKQDGVPLYNLLNRWAAESPDEALAQWQAGTGLAAGDPAKTLIEMLAVRPGEEGDATKMQAALARLGPDQLERASRIVTEFADSNHAREVWDKFYPGLLEPLPATEGKQ